MGKSGIVLIAVALVVVLYLSQPAGAAPAQPKQQVAPPPPPDLGTQALDTLAQINAGAAMVNQVTSGAAVTQAVTDLTAAGTQIITTVTQTAGAVGTAVTETVTAAGTAANSFVAGVSTYLPYLGPIAALSIIIGGVAQTHRAYSPDSHQCCDVNGLGMRLNCRYDWDIMQCIYEVYDYPSWPREKKVNMIFAELQSWRGKVKAGSIMRMEGYRADSRTPHYYYTNTGEKTRPNLATDTAPNEFRILNVEEIAKYRAIKAEIIAYNKTLLGPRPVRIDAIKNYTLHPNYGYRIPGPKGIGWIWSHTLPDNLRYLTLGNANVTEFNINWLY